MALDAYSLCPCASGKKLKFCCQPVIDDLLAAEELLGEGGKAKQILKILEKVEAKQPNNPWALRLKTQSLWSLRELDAARNALDQLLKAHPDNPFGLGLKGLMQLESEGFEQAHEDFEKAIEKALTTDRFLARQLIRSGLSLLSGSDKYMAIRQYLNLQISVQATAEDQRQAIQVLNQFDHDQRTPVPFRSPYLLSSLPENQPHQEEFQKGLEAASRCRFTEAARIFERLSKKDPHQPVFSRNAGLCYAWAGMNAAASELLGQAADDIPDFESAVELEALAQLLEMQHPDAQMPLNRYTVPVHAVSKLLSVLDDSPLLKRLPVNPEVPTRAAAEYQILSHAVNETDPVTLENASMVLGRAVVFSEDTEHHFPAQCVILKTSLAFNDQTLQSVLQIGGESLGEAKPADPLDFFPKDYAPMFWEWVLPERLSELELEALDLAKWQELLYQQWPNLPLEVLDGQTPSMAAKDEDLHLPLCAALWVLHWVCARQGHVLDVGDLRRHLGLPEMKSFTLEELSGERSVPSLPSLSLWRLPIKELSDEQFRVMLSRGWTLGEPGLLKPILLAGLERPQESRNPMRLSNFYLELAEACTALRQRNESLSWWSKSHDQLVADNAPFEARVSAAIRELHARLEDQSDPALPDLLRRIGQFAKKVPSLAEGVQGILAQAGVRDPFLLGLISTSLESETVGAGVGSETPGGLWTPEGSAPAAGGTGSKLWVPGQD